MLDTEVRFVASEYRVVIVVDLSRSTAVGGGYNGCMWGVGIEFLNKSLIIFDILSLFWDRGSP